jgi:hypothetical protein
MRLLKIMIFASVILCCFCAPHLFAADGGLTITELAGTVLVKPASSTEFITGIKGQVLGPKDSIKTEADGKVILELPDKSNVTLKPNSELTVEDIVWGETSRKANVNLSAGKLRAIVQKSDGKTDFKVRTPSAICGVRGTIVYVMVEGVITEVYVEDGTVEFTNTVSGDSQTVPQGTSSTSSDDGTVTAPSEPAPEAVDNIVGGWDAGLVAEPYAPPADAGPGAAGGRTADEIVEGDVPEESPASPV